MVAPFILFLLLFSQPESPRWHLQQAFKRLKRAGDTQYEEPNDRLEDNARRHFKKAYMALDTLRYNDLETGRDFFLLWYLLKDKTKNSGMSSGSKRMFDLVKKPRCYHAFTAGLTVMFLQQFCGVNILAYYSSTVYKSADVPNIVALSVSFVHTQAQRLFKDIILIVKVLFGIRRNQLDFLDTNDVYNRSLWPAKASSGHFSLDGDLPTWSCSIFPRSWRFEESFSCTLLVSLRSRLQRRRRSRTICRCSSFRIDSRVDPRNLANCPRLRIQLYASESLPLYNRDYGTISMSPVSFSSVLIEQSI